MKKPRYILPVIILSQFLCTSLWFAGNAVLSDLILNFGLTEESLGYLTSSVQLGFIVGALVFAIFCFADRFSPSKVFFVSSMLAAVFNLGLMWEGNNLSFILGFRFMTGFFLAGIYPVGMKIASDYYEGGLGRSLSYLVGALVLGTAFPHLLTDFPALSNCNAVLGTTSILCLCGGLLMYFLVPDGPYRSMGHRPDFSAFFTVFKNKKFRSAAFGYFGHMWELYAFWAFVPVILGTYKNIHPDVNFSIPFISFLIIAIGAVSCVMGGYLASHFGNKRIAYLALFMSFLCCLISPFLFDIDSENIFIAVMLFWGMVVIADSPLFSTLVAQNADVQHRGTGLTIVTSLGFAITIVSIQLLNSFSEGGQQTWIYALLSIGPLIGLMALKGAKY